MARYVKNVGAPAMPKSDDVQGFVEHARKLVDDEVTLRLGKSASDLQRLAEVLRTASARLEGSLPAPYFESVANQIDRGAELLRNANIREVADGVQRFARQRPLLYLGGAFLVGLGAGRFLRSSALPALPSGGSAGETMESESARPSARRPRNQAHNTRNAS